MIVAMGGWDVFGALVVASVFVVFLMYVVTDLGELLAEQLEVDEVGADGAFTPPLGLTATATTVGADTFPREWVVARVPFDQDNA